MKVGSVFISHSSRSPDHEVAKALAESLIQTGLDVWWDEARLEGGHDFPAKILEAIISQHFFLYIISPRSVHSDWCARELHCATELSKACIPLLLEEIPLEERPIELARLQYIPINQGVSEALPKVQQALGLTPISQAVREDPFATDTRLIQAIADQLTYAQGNLERTLNIVLMLKSIGESCCKTGRAKLVFDGLLPNSRSSVGTVDYSRARNYLLRSWQQTDK